MHRFIISVMSLERFTAASAEQLADDLTRFAYARDRMFATGKTDMSAQIAIRETRVTADDDSDDVLAPGNQERIELTSYRSVFIPGKSAPRPSEFILSYRKVDQIDSVPDQLRHVLHPDIVDQYDRTEPGDLNEVHEVDYAVTLDPDGEVCVGRDIKYRLRDLKEVIYKVSESKLPKAKKVYVATEGDHILVRPVVLPEMIDDIGLRLQVGVDFCFYTLNEIDAMEQNWLDIELLDQVACINAIMNSFTTGRPVARTV